MKSKLELDRLLVSMDVAVHHFGVCEVRRGRRLIGARVDQIMAHYVLAGTMHMTIEGAPTLVCGPGSLVLVPPGLQPGMSPDDAPDAELVAAEHCTISRDGMLLFDAADGGRGDLRIVAGLIGASVSGSFGLLDGLRTALSEQLGDLPVVQHAYAAMLDEIAAPTFGSAAITSALMKTCLILFLRRQIDRSNDSGLIAALGNPRMAGAVSKIVADPGAPHTVAALAAAVGMSVSTFSRHFTACFAMSPMEFVAKTRLRHAADLLRSTALPVKVIASSIGFASRSHFSRAFRDAYGVDPSSFRDRHADGSIDAPAHLRGSRDRFALSEEPTA